MEVMLMDKQQFLAEYQDVFKEPGKDVFFSPGRINVIGEHTDYNGGHVFHVRSVLEPMGYMDRVRTQQSPFTQLIQQKKKTVRLLLLTLMIQNRKVLKMKSGLTTLRGCLFI